MGGKIGFKPIKTIFRNIAKISKYTSADIGKIDDDYIVVMQKVDDANVSAGDDNFVSDVVREQMVKFREQIKKCQGTSIRGRKPTNERLLTRKMHLEKADLSFVILIAFFGFKYIFFSFHK